MPRGRPRVPKEPKRKAVKVRLAPRLHAGQVTEPYRVMEAIIASDRQDLDGVKIGIAWHTGWRPDADGVRTHGKCVRRTDLDRSLDSHDVLILLNEQSWKAFDDTGKQRLIFHELEHIQIAKDKNGGSLLDDKGRVVIRLRRHDIADFREVIERFGLPECLSTVQINDGDRPLLRLAEEKDPHARQYTLDADGFVTDPIVIEVPVPEFLKAEVSLLFACLDDLWYYGFEIKGRVQRSRRINVHAYNGMALVRCLNDLADNIEESLRGDETRLAEFLGWKINTAIDAVRERDADLAEAMAAEVHLPADFATEEGSATEDTESTEMEDSGDEGPEPVNEPIVIKCKGMKRACVKATIRHDADGWRYLYEAQLGNYAGVTGTVHQRPYRTRRDCLCGLDERLTEWLADLEITGTADQRRAMTRRRDIMREQVVAELDQLIDAAASYEEGTDATDTQEIPFAEDPPRAS